MLFGVGEAQTDVVKFQSFQNEMLNALGFVSSYR